MVELPAAEIPAADLSAAEVTGLTEAAGLPALAEVWQPLNQPAPPFHMLGNLFYVGASSVTSFLITTAEGHVLIDGGFEQTAPMIRQGIESLGFRLEDVRWLLSSHGHLDHAGGLAALKEASGARLGASALETPLLERGGLQDDLWGDTVAYPPVGVDRRLEPGESLEFGGMKFVAHVTAGHTRGCTSWEFEVVHKSQPLRVVSICSLSVMEEMVFEGEPSYPGIKQDFERSFETLGGLHADVFLASHAGFFKLEDKRRALEALPLQSVPSANPFVDPEGYRDYLVRARERFDEALAKERDLSKD